MVSGLTGRMCIRYEVCNCAMYSSLTSQHSAAVDFCSRQSHSVRFISDIRRAIQCGNATMKWANNSKNKIQPKSSISIHKFVTETEAFAFLCLFAYRESTKIVCNIRNRERRGKKMKSDINNFIVINSNARGSASVILKKKHLI